MYRTLAAALHRGKAQVRDDLRADPHLRYILLLAALLSVFWIWHRLPNFATRDERWRVFDVAQPVGFFIEDPSFGSIRDGVVSWRNYGGTFYIYLLVLLPVFLFLLVTGEGGAIVDVAHYSLDSLRADWQRVPSWVWTALVLPARLVNVALAVGSVYVVYRIGTEVRDRATGRLAALLTALTWGVLVLAHEAGEGVPALFCFLLAVYLALRYVETGARGTFYWGCLCGGLAAGFKFNAGVAALVLGAAHLTVARRAEGSWWRAALRPKFLVTGMAIGAVAIAASYPQVLVGAPFEVTERIGRGVSAKDDIHSWLAQPSWWWIARGYLNGLGLPLVAASLVSTAAAAVWTGERSRVGVFARFALLAVWVTLFVYSRWAYVRTHHLLVTFPLLVVLVAVGAERLRERRETVGVVLVAALLLSTGAYAVVGDLGYANQGRDESAAWLAENSDPGDTVEVYVRDPQEMGVPHGMDIHKPGVPGEMPAVRERCPEFVLLEQHRSLLYLAPANHSYRADVFDDPDAREYVGNLLAGDVPPYEVAGRFGREPRYLRGEPRRDRLVGLLWAGVQPRTIQYGDPQDLGTYQYSVILERTGPCEAATT